MSQVLKKFFEANEKYNLVKFAQNHNSIASVRK